MGDDPRVVPRVDIAGSASPPPPPWFTLFAALVPALPYACFAPPLTLLVWLPVYVLIFYTLPRPVPMLTPCVLLCFVVTYRALLLAGWPFWGKLVLTPPLGFLMNLVDSALWDTIEPFLVGQPGFGRGRQVPSRAPKGSQPGERVTAASPSERVTAASSILAGDPTRAAAASAFTQAEIDMLQQQGMKPWDPEARAALAILEGSEVRE